MSMRAPRPWTRLRAVSRTPRLGQDIDKYVRTVYTNFHGSGEGLDQLKQLAVQSPLPPADFKLKTASEIAAEKEAEFAKSNPQLALWMGVRKELSDAAGDQYFESKLKNAAVPKPKGTLWRPSPAADQGLLVALSDAKNPEVTLKLDAGLDWQAGDRDGDPVGRCPLRVSKEPFMLTMDTEKAKIEGLKAAPWRPPVRRGAAKKKK